MLGKEGVFRADDLAFEISCESWVVFCQAYLVSQISVLLYPYYPMHNSVRTLYA